MLNLLDRPLVETPLPDAAGYRTAGPAGAEIPPASRPEWQLAQRIAASRGFAKSGLLRSFLFEVCELFLAGRAQEITEQHIGIRVFGRPAGYDPGEDNIVRSYARLLRKRLACYFAEEGAGEPLRVSIPRGGYVPVFEAVPTTRTTISSTPPAPFLMLSAPAPEPHPSQPPQCECPAADSKPRFEWYSAAAGVLAGCAVALLVWAGVHAVHLRRQHSAAHVLWTHMFESNRNTLIVPADSGLGILENLTHNQVNVDGYANGSFLAQMHPPAGLDAGNFNDLSRQHYTSVVDLDISSALVRLPEYTPDRTQIRYARSVATEDLRSSNVILLGSVHTNPWVSLFDQRLNFRFQYTPEVDRSFLVNQHPQAGEATIYRNATAGELDHTYGTVAYLPGAGGAGHILLVQGLNMAATQAAADILFDARAIQPVLAQAAGRDGTLRPFELLVETTSINAAAPEARIIATRVYPQS